MWAAKGAYVSKVPWTWSRLRTGRQSGSGCGSVGGTSERGKEGGWEEGRGPQACRGVTDRFLLGP